MNHLGELLSALLDGELRPHEHNRVTTHLSACDRCRADLEEVQRARASVRSLPVLEAPRLVVDLQPYEAARTRRHPWALALAAAAVLVVAIGVSAVLGETPRLQVDYSDISTTHRVRTVQDGTPTGARLVQITPYAATGAE